MKLIYITLILCLLITGSIFADSTFVRGAAGVFMFNQMSSSAPTNTFNTNDFCRIERLDAGGPFYQRAVGYIGTIRDSIGGDNLDSLVCTLFQSAGTAAAVNIYGIWKPFWKDTANYDAWFKHPTDDSAWTTAGAGSTDDNGPHNTGDGTGADRTATAWTSPSWSGGPGTALVFVIKGTALADSTDNCEYKWIIQAANDATDFRFYHEEVSTESSRPRMWIYHTASSGINPPATVTIDSLENDYSAELDSLAIHTTTTSDIDYDLVCIAWSISGYPDSSSATDTLMHAFSASTTYHDTLRALNYSETYTLYVSTWQIESTGNFWSSRTTQSRTYSSVAADSDAPDPYDAFVINFIANLNPDTVHFTFGSVDSVDLASMMIRYGTTIPTTTASGTLLINTTAIESDTARYILTVFTEPDWIYFTIFAGDEIPNWSTGVSDSVYFPGGGQSTGRTNRAYEHLRGIQNAIIP